MSPTSESCPPPRPPSSLARTPLLLLGAPRLRLRRREQRRLLGHRLNPQRLGALGALGLVLPQVRERVGLLELRRLEQRLALERLPRAPLPAQ